MRYETQCLLLISVFCAIAIENVKASPMLDSIELLNEIPTEASAPVEPLQQTLNEDEEELEQRDVDSSLAQQLKSTNIIEKKAMRSFFLKKSIQPDENFKKISKMFVDLYKLLVHNQVSAVQKKVIVGYLNELSKELLKYIDESPSKEAFLKNLFNKINDNNEEVEKTETKASERQTFKWGK